jgi:hypothetical protein
MDTNEKDVFLHKQNAKSKERQSKPRLRVSHKRYILSGKIRRIVVPLSISLSAST